MRKLKRYYGKGLAFFSERQPTAKLARSSWWSILPKNGLPPNKLPPPPLPKPLPLDLPLLPHHALPALRKSIAAKIFIQKLWNRQSGKVSPTHALQEELDRIRRIEENSYLSEHGFLVWRSSKQRHWQIFVQQRQHQSRHQKQHHAWERSKKAVSHAHKITKMIGCHHREVQNNKHCATHLTLRCFSAFNSSMILTICKSGGVYCNQNEGNNSVSKRF